MVVPSAVYASTMPSNDENNPYELSPEAAQWAEGFDEGKRLARGGLVWQRGLNSKDPKDRGRVAGWRSQNGLRATPLEDPYDDLQWGTAPEPATTVQ